MLYRAVVADAEYPDRSPEWNHPRVSHLKSAPDIHYTINSTRAAVGLAVSPRLLMVGHPHPTALPFMAVRSSRLPVAAVRLRALAAVGVRPLVVVVAEPHQAPRRQ